MANVGEFPWSWFLEERTLSLERKKEVRRRLFTSSMILAIRHFHGRSRARTIKKCTKKVWCTCKVVVLRNKPIASLTSSFPSPSSLLKLTRKPSLIFRSSYDMLICHEFRWKITKKGASLPCLSNLKNLQFPLMFFMGRWRLKLDTKYVSKRLFFFSKLVHRGKIMQKQDVMLQM